MLGLAKKYFKIRYDSEDNNGFVVTHRENGSTTNFRESPAGLHYIDMDIECRFDAVVVETEDNSTGVDYDNGKTTGVRVDNYNVDGNMLCDSDDNYDNMWKNLDVNGVSGTANGCMSTLLSDSGIT